MESCGAAGIARRFLGMGGIQGAVLGGGFAEHYNRSGRHRGWLSRVSRSGGCRGGRLHIVAAAGREGWGVRVIVRKEACKGRLLAFGAKLSDVCTASVAATVDMLTKATSCCRSEEH